MVLSANLGYPRIGLNREVKKGVESYWSGRIEKNELLKIGKDVRGKNWGIQKAIGIDHIPSNDFSYYDHVLDTILMTGAVPQGFNWDGNHTDLELYFGLARGVMGNGRKSTAPMEMTKWFDTNYHYIVPEFVNNQYFSLSSLKSLDEYNEAKAFGIKTRPVLLGPISFLLLGKVVDESFPVLDLLPNLLPIYLDMLAMLNNAGAEWVQIDEPFLVMDLDRKTQDHYIDVYKKISSDFERPKICLTTYFGRLGDNEDLVFSLPVEAIHLDFVRAPDQLDQAIKKLNKDQILSAGIINGRNIWLTDLTKTLHSLKNVQNEIGSDRLWIAPSCSLMHIPQDVELEIELNPEIRSWMAFGKQKLNEISILTKLISEPESNYPDILNDNQRIIQARNSSIIVNDPEVSIRMKSIGENEFRRNSVFGERKNIQQSKLNLPVLPTTSIGSFPQTNEVRKARADYVNEKINSEEYDEFIKHEIEKTIKFQQDIGLDVLVHGEFERNDMVQYFGEKFSGFVFTKHGWVQSFGTRYVRPPIIYGDVARPEPISVKWITYAQSLTDKPVKGMLTGPITILKWSFVRDDQPYSKTCQQIALAIRDEVVDLEKAGIKIIQIDEPALREGFPLRKAEWHNYLEWAINAFKLSSSGVSDQTQIHTHMCYSEFNDIMDSIAALDADVISIEASRSKMELLTSFAEYEYPNDIGPGVYDIHSPRIPTQKEIEELLIQAMKVIPKEQLWVNPDCGLKTRKWDEIRPSLIAMVEAAKNLR